MAKAKTYHDGANDERTAIKAYVKRQVKKSVDTTIDGGIVLQWISHRDERYRKRKGGL